MPTPRKLPRPDSEEGKLLAAMYVRSTEAEREGLTKQYGYANPNNFTTGMHRQYGLSVPVKEPTPAASEPDIILKIPKLREYKALRHKKGDEETAVLHTSDWHMDKITPSYNKDVARERVWEIFKSTMAIVNLHRNMYPINDLVIVDCGDRGQGENPHQGSKVPEISMGARDQQRLLVYPLCVELACTFKQHFRSVRYILLPGNHGHDKLAPETSRWDIMGADLIEARLESEKGIEVTSVTDWHHIFHVQGFKCFASHFDGIPCAQGIPYFGIDRKLKAWYIEYGGFNIAFGGHFHKFTHAEVTRRFQYFMAPSLVTDDAWALKKLGVSASPGATLLGIHPARGVTWTYNLEVDPAFRPGKIAVEEA